jgi:hypothetical protein
MYVSATAARSTASVGEDGGVTVGIGVGVRARVVAGVGVRAAVGVPVGVAVGVPVGVAVGAAVGVAVGVPVRVAVAVGVAVRVGVRVAVAVATGVAVGTPATAKLAVYVRDDPCVAKACVWAPPSDQLAKTYCFAPTLWGEGAPSVRRKPTTPMIVAGVVCVCPSSVTSKPGGSVVSVKSDVWGTMTTDFVDVRPVASVVLRTIS